MAKTTTRRGAFKIAGGLAAAVLVGSGVYYVAKGPSTLLRPPGAQGESDFMSRCIKCGKCMEACKYAAIHMATDADGGAVGTPCIDARAQACHMCDGLPCVAACPTGALRDCEVREDIDMGYAEIDADVCIAYKGLRCEVCYRSCPLIDQAMMLDYAKREGDEIHAIFGPVVNTDVCTGCGLCVQRCVMDEPDLPIRIVSRAEQERMA